MMCLVNHLVSSTNQTYHQAAMTKLVEWKQSITPFCSSHVAVFYIGYLYVHRSCLLTLQGKKNHIRIVIILYIAIVMSGMHLQVLIIEKMCLHPILVRQK